MCSDDICIVFWVGGWVGVLVFVRFRGMSRGTLFVVRLVFFCSLIYSVKVESTLEFVIFGFSLLFLMICFFKKWKFLFFSILGGRDFK